MVDFSRVDELLHYDLETGLFTWKVYRAPNAKCGDVAGFLRNDKNGLQYLIVRIDDERYYLHRLAFFLMRRRWPDQIDHINGDGSDNSWNNLREVNHRENHRNVKRQSNNTSGQTGVTWDRPRSKWAAQIHAPHHVYLGRFINYEDAVAARKQAEIDYGFHVNHGRK